MPLGLNERGRQLGRGPGGGESGPLTQTGTASPSGPPSSGTTVHFRSTATVKPWSATLQSETNDDFEPSSIDLSFLACASQ
jgi:hypothetical protein